MKKFLFLFMWLPYVLFAVEKVPLVMDNGKNQYTLTVEVVQSETERAQGLMGRKELPDNQGMLFVFAQPTQSPFWMKNTSIPLSIGFLDEEGRLLQVLDMEPCRQEPCPLYIPEVPYRYALEVLKGWFKTHGIEKGARAQWPH